MANVGTVTHAFDRYLRYDELTAWPAAISVEVSHPRAGSRNVTLALG